MNSSRNTRSASALSLMLCLSLAVAFAMLFPAVATLLAQSPPQKPADNPDLDSVLDPYQRSGLIYYQKLMGNSGADRGEHIYYLKCWICHNEYAIASDPKGAAPTLKGLYQRPQLLSGEPVNDDTVAAKIRAGGPRMPSYRYFFNDKDMADLLAYLRDKCCWDADNPPANPRYKAK
jgi:Cytochrome C oxidase, cbb3-type, subunit III